ncbi:hypothetical protein [Streptomyces sp. NL15-2K]|uniref:hypothetical protein n=1 Tax=Streptomyces sp. NL15-2K TaxID=376149 RepID=UPI00209C2918|nr:MULTISPECIES: hypothetical protein [Actinomycetes]WKX11564.1 hypothetical protein Q4V64_30255 [Kutzneria buriramensis]
MATVAAWKSARKVAVACAAGVPAGSTRSSARLKAAWPKGAARSSSTAAAGRPTHSGRRMVAAAVRPHHPSGRTDPLAARAVPSLRRQRSKRSRWGARMATAEGSSRRLPVAAMMVTVTPP